MVKTRSKMKQQRPAPEEFIVLKSFQSSDEEGKDGKRSVGTDTGITMKSKGIQTVSDYTVLQIGESNKENVLSNRSRVRRRKKNIVNRRSDASKEKENKCSFSFSNSHLSSHFDVMQLMGWLYIGREDRVFSWKSAFHLAAFGLSYIIAILWELGRGKHYMLSYQKPTTVLYIITTWYYFHASFISTYFLKLLFQNAVGKFLTRMDNIKNENTKKKNQTQYDKMSKVTVGLTILNILISGYMATGLNWVWFKGLDHEDLMVVREFQLKGRFIYWEKEDYNNRIDQLENITKLETEDIVYGCVENGIRFIGWLHYTTIKDTVLFAALDLYSYTNEFKNFLHETRNEPISLPLLGTLESNWETLHLVSNEIESHFGPLFNWIALHNWLHGAYRILAFMKEDFKFDLEFLLDVVMFGKSLLAYSLAAKARKTGPMLKRRLSRKTPSAGSAKDMVLKANIVYLKGQINDTPVGMGAGKFHVDETFVYNYIGSVMTTAVAFFDRQKKDGA